MSATRQFAFAVLISMAAIACNGNNNRAANEATPGGTPGAAGTSGTSMADRNFVEDMAADSQAEITLGQLAQQKATTPEVKEFGEVMVRDHTKANEELKGIAAKHNIELKADLSDDHKDLRERLAKLSGSEFDREYMKAMVDGHREVEKMLAARMSKGGATPDELSLAAKVDQWAARTLPDVRAHLKEAEQVYGELAKGE